MAYSSLYQPAWLLLLAWVDVVPWFGASLAGDGNLFRNTVFALGCSFAGAGGPACTTELPNFGDSSPPVPVWAFLYVIGASEFDAVPAPPEIDPHACPVCPWLLIPP